MPLPTLSLIVGIEEGLKDSTMSAYNPISKKWLYHEGIRFLHKSRDEQILQIAYLAI
jgi:hypothetical protein